MIHWKYGGMAMAAVAPGLLLAAAEWDWTRIVEALCIAAPPTIMAWRALQASKENRVVADKMKLAVDDTKKGVEEVHKLANSPLTAANKEGVDARTAATDMAVRVDRLERECQYLRDQLKTSLSIKADPPKEGSP